MRPLKPIASRLPRSMVNPVKRRVARPVAWNLDALAILWGTDKGPGFHGYTSYYARHLRRKRKSVRSVLEIGVGGYHFTYLGGNSLYMWRSYFPNATIYGLDLHPKRLSDDSRIVTIEGDQADKHSLERVRDLCPRFDFIVDDGSHIGSDAATSFEFLFSILAPGGLYAIEDLATSYNPHFGGGPPGTDDTAVALTKGLLDDVNVGPRSVAAVHAYPGLVLIEKRAEGARARTETFEFLLKTKPPQWLGSSL
jgi:hypothetical protein